ncbi:MAG: hypothetical protein LBS24_06745 [Clostridiales Family XIII bacterium]|nr:hypothetical protein [Clostridiales Family XIII bacterium]
MQRRKNLDRRRADAVFCTYKFPSELSCAEASVSAPQAITANITAATVVVCIVYNILARGECEVKSVTFSAKIMNVKSERAAARRKAA